MQLTRIRARIAPLLTSILVFVSFTYFLINDASSHTLTPLHLAVYIGFDVAAVCMMLFSFAPPHLTSFFGKLVVVSVFIALLIEIVGL